MQRYALSPSQLNISAQEFAVANSDVNVLYFVLKIEKSIDAAAMEKAVQTFLRKNAAARVRIVSEGGSVMQYFADYEEAEIPVVDLSDCEDWESVVRGWGQTPFQFYGGVLYDFKILKFTEDQWGLFCKFHHIWVDGWSTGLIWSDILSAYCRISAGENGDVLEARPLFIEAAPSDSDDEDSRFWKDYLSGIELPPSDSIESDYSANRRILPMPQDLSVLIKDFAATNGVTPYTVFMAALSVYVNTVQSMPEVLLGLPRQNRRSDYLRNMLGVFVMEVPLRLRLSDGRGFSNLCRFIGDEGRRLSVHCRYPLTKIISDLHETLDFSGSLAEYSVSYQKEKITIPGYDLPVSVWFGNPAAALNRMTMHVLDLFDDGYTIFYDYLTAYYDDIGIEYFHDALLGIIRQGIANPKAPVIDLICVGDAERAAMERTSGEFDLVHPEGETVVDMFARQAAAKPNAIAVRGVDGAYTFAQADEASNKIARALERFGPLKDRFVGVLMPRTAASVVSALGVLKAGGAFLWMNMEYPKERLNYMRTDSNAAAVIDEAFYEAAMKLDGSKVDVRPAPGDLCYCIYTSGTTGNPKGVMLEHRGLYNLCMPESSRIVGKIAEKGTAALSMASFSFDFSIFEVFTSLMNGVSIVVASEKQIESPTLLGQLVQQHNVNVICATPSRLLSYCEIYNFRNALSNAAVLLSAGESFPSTLFDVLHTAAPQAEIYNGYGPTEATVGASFMRVTGGRITLGDPMANFRLRVLSATRSLVPVGFVGELYIGGCGLARGYLNLPRETAAAFIEFEGERYYKTGDLVRRERDGGLLFCGRRDKQIKLRGFRIELDEIEHGISAFEGITGCALSVRKVGKVEFLCAFYTATTSIDEKALKESLSRMLPYYMVPSVYRRLDAIPLAPSGKVDQKALSRIEIEFTSEYVAPETENEKKLCEILCRVLGFERVSVTDNFFEIGGDSLSAAQYAIEMTAAGFSFSFSDIFANPTVRQLCLYAESGMSYDQTLDGEIQNYDYNKLAGLMKWNGAEPTGKPVKSILLTGATGYLGSHLLYELITHTDCTIYCLVRKSGRLTPEKRLKGRLFYYFEDNYSEEFGTRVFTVTGDLTQPGVFDEPFEHPVDLVLNCAADVAHYAYGDKLRRINLGGVKNMIEIALKHDARLMQISTVSVGQFGIAGVTEKKEAITEEDFFFGQDLSNEYNRTKFLAEREILDAMVRRGLRANILRVGNLQGRFSDGEFQINNASNGFANRLKAYSVLGFMPREMLEASVEYSPVDYTAKAIRLFAVNETSRAVLHIFNDKPTPFKVIFSALEKQGHSFEKLPGEQYAARVQEMLGDPETRNHLSEIVEDLTGEMNGKFEIGFQCLNTRDVLADMGFEWPEINENYLQVYIDSLEKLGYFEV